MFLLGGMWVVVLPSNLFVRSIKSHCFPMVRINSSTRFWRILVIKGGMSFMSKSRSHGLERCISNGKNLIHFSTFVS